LPGGGGGGAPAPGNVTDTAGPNNLYTAPGGPRPSGQQGGLSSLYGRLLHGLRCPRPKRKQVGQSGNPAAPLNPLQPSALDGALPSLPPVQGTRGQWSLVQLAHAAYPATRLHHCTPVSAHPLTSRQDFPPAPSRVAAARRVLFRQHRIGARAAVHSQERAFVQLLCPVHCTVQCTLGQCRKIWAFSV
jgi:hypothetical protein